ncbi:2-oxoacid:acceptor oxidoreductase family protein [Actinomycetota bacterium]
MFEVRIHGRGGQGVVTAAELLSEAAFEEGRHAQAFPSFGSERTGAPVVAFCRIADNPIRVREPVMVPDALVVQDSTLIHQVDLFAGLKPDGYVLVNSSRSIHELGLEDLLPGREGRVRTVPATALAKEHIGRPLPNAVLLGALAGITGLVHLPSVTGAIADRFPKAVAEANIRAATAAYELVLKEAAHASAD